LSIKSFAIDIFAEVFSKKSALNMIDSEFRSELFTLILQTIATGPPSVASSAANFVATLSIHEDGRLLVEENATITLQTLMERLVAVDRLTSINIEMRESLVHATMSLGQHVMGTAFPTGQVLQPLLIALPIRKHPEFANLVYQFVNSVHQGVPDELQMEFIRIYAWVFARPESQIELLKMSSLALLQSALTLDKALARLENPEEMLERDEYRLTCFQPVFTKYREKAQIVFVSDVG
jgi:hypothetical protein